MIASRAAELPEGLRTVDEALHRTRFRILPFLGPAFIACVAYIDPGNFATNIAGGAKYGYMLLWVIVAANLMAMLVQYLSAKVGVATGRSLPELCRDVFPRPVTWGLWVQAEVIAIATDLAYRWDGVHYYRPGAKLVFEAIAQALVALPRMAG